MRMAEKVKVDDDHVVDQEKLVESDSPSVPTEQPLVEPGLSKSQLTEIGVSLTIWFILNGSIVMLSRYLLMERIAFKFPILLTMLHMLTGYCLSSLIIPFTSLEKIPFSASTYTVEVMLFIGLFVGNIVLGNMSLQYIHVSFMQTIKASTPFYVTLFQFLIYKTRFRTITVVSLIPVVLGVIIATLKEVEFHIIGFTCAVASCVVQGIQIVLGGKLMKTKLDPLNMARLLGPAAFVALLPLVLLNEGPKFQLWMHSEKANTVSYFLVVLSCLTAAFLNFTTFWVFKVVSGTTYSVAGNLKVVLLVIVSVMIFQNPITLMGWMGCGITVAGCFWYASIKEKTIN